MVSALSYSSLEQARLDEEIAALTTVLCNLRTQRNALSPIARIPPEILASVFIRCAQNCKQSRYAGHSVPQWVNVSYVCRSWRDVALNCPILWSFLFVSSQHWTNELLTRSKSCPLNVCMDSEYPKQSKELDLLESVAHQAYRIRDLCLRLTRREADRILSMFSSPAPLLQTLRISVEKSSYLGEPTLITAALCAGHTPAIRELELINYMFPLTSPTLRGLTSLRLRDLGASFQPTIAELYSALSRMHDLEHLYLENALPSSVGNSSKQSLEYSVLGFPRLSRLSIIAPLSTVVHVLSHLDLPLKTQVRLRCCFEAGNEDHAPVYVLVSRRFILSKDEACNTVPVIRALLVETTSATVGFVFSTVACDARHTFSANTTSYELGQLYEDWDSGIPLKLDVVLRTSLSKDREELIGSVCCSIPLTNLQSAQINFDIGTALSSSFWTNTFGYLEELRYIKLSQANLQGLVQVLSLSPHHSRKNTGRHLGVHPDQIFAPALEVLEFYNIDFSKACFGRLQGSPDHCSCSVQCLYDALSNRRAEGHGLQRLVIAECMYVFDYDVEGLKGNVTEVNWDGITRTVPDPESGGDEASDEDVRHHSSFSHFGMTRFHPFD